MNYHTKNFLILSALAVVIAIATSGCAAYDSSPDCIGNMPKCSPRPSNILNGWDAPEASPPQVTPPAPGVSQYQKDVPVQTTYGL